MTDVIFKHGNKIYVKTEATENQDPRDLIDVMRSVKKWFNELKNKGK